ncbi:MAG: hypothetical protein U0414_04195 [Polyangiaceae bacterium]
MFSSVYFTIDRRTLGLTRVCLGWFLICDLFRRTGDWLHMFGDTGVLPTLTILKSPQASNFSFLYAFHAPWELWTLWSVILATYVCLLIGFKTKVMQVLSLLFVASMNGRVLLIENGGYVVHNLLLLWTCFMPLGDRFSLDSLLRSMKRRRERTPLELNDRTDVIEPYKLKPFSSLVCLVILVQLSAVYYFNKIHKWGPDWTFKNATAVHYVMYVDRMVNPIVADVRTKVPFWAYQQMTRAVLLAELLLAYFLLAAILPNPGQRWVFAAPIKPRPWYHYLAPWVAIGWLARTMAGPVPSEQASARTASVVSWVTLPASRLWARRFVLLLMNFLHIGFGSTFVLGPFAWALCIFSTLLFSREDWEATIAVAKREHRRRTVLYDPTSGAALWFCRLLKRVDNYALLGFDEANATERAHRIVVERMDGSVVTGARALREIIDATPIGAAFVWLFTPVSLMDRPRAWLAEALPDPARASGLGVLVAYAQIAGGYAWYGVWIVCRAIAMPLRFVAGAFFSALGEWIMRPGRWSRFFRLEAEDPRADFDETATIWFRMKSGAGGFVREALCLFMFMGALNQAMTELWVTKSFWQKTFTDANQWLDKPEHKGTKDALKWIGDNVPYAKYFGLTAPLTQQPEAMQDAAHKFRFLQGWFMFSPNPVKDDGTIIVDAITEEGRHVDPFWNTPPNLVLHDVQSYGYNQIWSDYFNRIHGNRNYREAMIDYLRRLPERTGNPKDALVSGSVYWIKDWNPKFGTTESFNEQQELMFTFDERGNSKDPPPPPKKPDGQ